MSSLAKRATGEEVKQFSNAQEALDFCDLHVPDVVFVDFMMPGLDGHGFIERFRAKLECSTVPLVMVTAADESSVRSRAFELGATEFIGKPIDNLEFKLRAKNLLALRRAQTNLEQQVRQATDELLARELEMMETIAQAAEFRDPETGAHTQRVGLYSRLIAQGLGLAEQQVSDIQHAAPMHDLGKIGIPDSILMKGGPLDEAEWAVMKTHPAIGAKIAGKSASPVMKLAREIAMSHHEKWDGSGYPAGLAGDLIPLSGRIVAVADVFDALTTDRPYKAAWSVERAREHMEAQMGIHFCPMCAKVFFDSWDDVLAIKASLPDR